MELYDYIQIFSALVWLTIPFVRTRSKHFYFFLFLGISDFISGFSWYALGTTSQALLIPILYLLIFSIDRDFFVRNIKWLLVGLVFFFIINFYSTTYIQYLFSLVTDIVITTIFARLLYWEYLKNSKISLFYIVMTFYGLFSVYKSILMVGNINLGLNAYYATLIIQIFIGLFLIFVRKDCQFALKD